MDLLAALLRMPAEFAGPGRNHEGEDFDGRLVIRALAARSAVLLGYRAVRGDGHVVHTEDTLLGRDGMARLCLWPVMQELAFVLPHPLASTDGSEHGLIRCVFASGPRDDAAVFREEIEIALGPGPVLTYAHAWGLPGGAFGARSRCVMRPRGA